MTAELPTIESCPSCEYDLRGLPASHYCPECGFAYDESFRMWRGRKHGVVIHAVVAFAFIFLAFDQILRSYGMGPPRAPHWQPWVHWLVATAFLLVYGILLRYVLLGLRPCILINNNVLAYRFFGKFKEYQWDEIWVPDPNRFWVKRPELPADRSASETPKNSLLCMLRRDRGRYNQGDIVYRLSCGILAAMNAEIRLPLQHFPRRDRKQIMQAIYERWLERTEGILSPEFGNEGA